VPSSSNGYVAVLFFTTYMSCVVLPLSYWASIWILLLTHLNCLREKTGRSLLVLQVLTCASAHQHAQAAGPPGQDPDKFELKPHI
jgi:hypothetical protein